MRFESIQRRSISAGMALIVTLGIASSSRADLQFTFKLDSGATVTPSPTPGDPTSSGGQQFIISSYPLSQTVSVTGGIVQSDQAGPTELLSQGLKLSNTDSVSHTLTITVTATGYKSPTTPPALLFQTIGTEQIVTGSTGSIQNGDLTFTSFVGGANPIGPLSAVQNPMTPGVYSVSGSTLVTSLAAPFTMSESVTLILEAKSNVQVQINSTLTATPEPSTVAMAMTTLPLLGFGAWVRRLRSRA